ncbi:MAG: multidrug effflux MFS transporter [Pseudomonadota bacterium]
MTSPTASPRHAPLSYTAFVILTGALMGMNPLAIDIMLPGFDLMTDHFGLQNPNRVQQVITAYLLGFGIGQLFVGVFADRFGRKPILLWGIALYGVTGLACVAATSFELLLAARFVQGVASAAPRVASTAMVRDCYDGRVMARVMSLALTFFMAVPLMAPLIGQILILLAPWQSVFLFLSFYAAVVALICWRSLPETLAPEHRRAIRWAPVQDALGAILRSRQTVGYSIAAGVFFGALFGFVNSAQQIMVGLFGLGPLFPVVFAIIAFGVSLSAFVNAQLVERMGMRRISHGAIFAFIGLSLVMLGIELAGLRSLWSFLPVFSLQMLVIGLVFSNFNALAMEPQGRIAGMASSFVGAASVLIGALVGFAIGAAYDGTLLPLSIGFTLCGLVVLALLVWTERGRLFGAKG